MAAIRISTKQVKEIKLEDQKTWPVDLQVWVELSTLKPWKEWDAPFYLKPELLAAFKKLIAAAIEARAKKMTVRRGPTYCHASN
jgi:hypothetical protein